ncbi:hypothetical protein ATANTOWER_014834 [Ataeniobius toweri]|uniref:Uncharacterized protein n=1 Tax=Ataeniobius toweri TaxID=208326 RepID=A0ABU7B7N0_9TELE|nr:hypothetical protein [Ataeniobius toweri]
MQKIQTLSPQDNFTDYLLTWLRSGFKSPQAFWEQTWLTLHRAPHQDLPPGSTSTSSASETELPGPFTYPTHSQSFPSSHFSCPLADLLITLCKQKYIKIDNPEYYLSLTIDPFSIQRRVPVSPANKIFLNKLVKTFPVFLSVFCMWVKAARKTMTEHSGQSDPADTLRRTLSDHSLQIQSHGSSLRSLLEQQRHTNNRLNRCPDYSSML